MDAYGRLYIGSDEVYLFDMGKIIKCTSPANFSDLIKYFTGHFDRSIFKFRPKFRDLIHFAMPAILIIGRALNLQLGEVVNVAEADTGLHVSN